MIILGNEEVVSDDKVSVNSSIAPARAGKVEVTGQGKSGMRLLVGTEAVTLNRV